MTKEGGRKIHYKIHKLINFIWDNEELPEEWKNSISVPIYKTGDKRIVVIIGAYKLCQLCTKSYPTSNVKAKSTCRRKHWQSSIWISTQQVNANHIFCIGQILETKWKYGEEFIICR
jgi:hypothetical protein